VCVCVSMCVYVCLYVRVRVCVCVVGEAPVESTGSTLYPLDAIRDMDEPLDEHGCCGIFASQIRES
jgi:hypothetical protein